MVEASVWTHQDKARLSFTHTTWPETLLAYDLISCRFGSFVDSGLARASEPGLKHNASIARSQDTHLTLDENVEGIPKTTERGRAFLAASISQSLSTNRAIKTHGRGCIPQEKAVNVAFLVILFGDTHLSDPMHMNL
jgi:hypothetical protein